MEMEPLLRQWRLKTPVKDDTADEEIAANTAKDSCSLHPDIYKLNYL